MDEAGAVNRPGQRHQNRHGSLAAQQTASQACSKVNMPLTLEQHVAVRGLAAAHEGLRQWCKMSRNLAMLRIA